MSSIFRPRRRYRFKLMEWVAAWILLGFIALVSWAIAWMFSTAVFPIFVVGTLAWLMESDVSRG